MIKAHTQASTARLKGAASALSRCQVASRAVISLKFYNSTLMAVLTLGLNHQTAPLDLRGRLAFSPGQLPAVLQDFQARLARAAPEAALLSTCNRTELYLATDATQAREIAQPALEWLATQGGISGSSLQPHTYLREERDAARHAFRVASGLDSMVLGEPQILGQMKEAVREADAAGTLGTTLHQLFQRSFAVAKEVRSSTEVGSHSISMAAASVRLAAQLFEDLRDVRVLLVGAGEMIELVATHFAGREPKMMAVANRTLERGEKLAARFGAQALRLTDLSTRLHEFDVVVSCTASSLPLIGLGAVERALKLRRHKPMFMVDLAVPRDIEPEVTQLDDVYLYTVDDLSAIVQLASEKRQAAVEQAEAIIDAGVQSFAHWLDQRASVPLIQALNRRAEEWREAELARARRRIAKGEDPLAVMEALSHALSQKMLHGAFAELQASDGEKREAVAQAISRLFLRGSGPSA